MAALKLPLLFGWENRYIGLMVGPTVHTGYRFCRDSAGSTSSPAGTTGPVCSGADKGAFLAVGGHFGLQVPLGSFVEIMPEVGVLGIPLAPEARVVGPDDVRASFSEGQIITHVALGVQLGRFVREPRRE